MSIANQLPQSAAAVNPAETRREERYPAQAGVRLSLQVSPESEPEQVELRDISLHGFGISVSRYIEPGSNVVLRTTKQRIDAEIMYCKADGDRYRAGIVVRRARRERATPDRKRNWDNLIAGSRGR
jgi:PilZ domain-containing protein